MPASSMSNKENVIYYSISFISNKTYLPTPKKCRFLGQKEKKLISLKKFCMGVGNRHPVLLHSRSCEGTESSHFVLRHLSFVQRAISLG